jgi:hypothetical protein
MVRNYKRKHARNPDRRMIAAVRARERGMSLRQTAECLACSHQTVANDLARYDREHANVLPLSNSPVKNTPPGGKDLTPALDSNVVSLADRNRA